MTDITDACPRCCWVCARPDIESRTPWKGPCDEHENIDPFEAPPCEGCDDEAPHPGGDVGGDG